MESLVLDLVELSSIEFEVQERISSHQTGPHSSIFNRTRLTCYLSNVHQNLDGIRASITNIIMESKGIIVVNKKRYEQAIGIGQGVQGKVFRVLEPVSQTELAIKVVKRSGYSDIDMLLDREVQILKKLGQLNCRSIIRLVDLEITATHNYLVMELGQYSLAFHREMNDATLDDTQIILLMRNICSALKAVHQINIIHRDIKPQNIIMNSLDPQYLFKLTDFGVSTRENPQTQTYIGTEPYMAPEVLDSRNVENIYTKTADIWSYAVVVFEAYFGFNPFQAKRMDVQLKHIDELTTNGLKFEKLAELLKKWDQHHLAAMLIKSYNTAPPELLEFLTKTLFRDPKRRATLSEIQKIINVRQIDVSKALRKTTHYPHGLEPAKLTPHSNYKLAPQSDQNQSYQPDQKNRMLTATRRQGISTTKAIKEVQAPITPIINTQYNPPNRKSMNQSVGMVTRQQNLKDIQSMLGSSMDISGFNDSKLTSAQSVYNNNNNNNNNKNNNLHLNKTISAPVAKTPNLTQTGFKAPSHPNPDGSKLEFILSVKSKLKTLQEIINVMIEHNFKDSLDFIDIPQFADLITRAVAISDFNQYENNPRVKSDLEGVYHKLWKTYKLVPDRFHKRFQDQNRIYQFLYELLVLANLKELTSNTLGAIKGMPQKISRIGYNPNNFFKHQCDLETLKQLEWRLMVQT